MLREQSKTRNEGIDEEVERECITLLIHGAMISAAEEQSFVHRVSRVFLSVITIHNLIHALGTRDAGHDEVQVGKATPYFLILGADISCWEDERAQMHPGEVARKEDQRMKQEEFDRAQGFVSKYKLLMLPIVTDTVRFRM